MRKVRSAKDRSVIDLVGSLVREDYRCKRKARPQHQFLSRPNSPRHRALYNCSSYPTLFRVASYQRYLYSLSAKRGAAAGPVWSGYACREPKGLRGLGFGSKWGVASLASLIHPADHQRILGLRKIHQHQTPRKMDWECSRCDVPPEI